MIFKRRKTHSKKRKAVHRRKRRNPAPAIALMGNPKRRRRSYTKHRVRRYRRNPGFGISKSKISNVLINGVAAAAGAAATMLVTNAVNKLLASKGKELSVANKNFVSLGVGIIFSILAPKLKIGKYADAAVTGSLAISLVNIASTSFGMSGMFSLSGETNPELDRIIANLNVNGQDEEDDDFSGVDLLGMAETMNGVSESDLLGISETMAGMEEDEYI